MQLSATVIHDCFVRNMMGQYDPDKVSEPLPIPSFLNAAATRAANYYFPITEPQREAQRAIYQALQDNDLEALIAALGNASSTAPGNRLTTDWWHCEWRRLQYLVKRLAEESVQVA